MTRSFGLVDDKAFEADFFLTKIGEVGHDIFAARCYFSAFVSSARSITFALQSVMGGDAEFHAWYEARQRILRGDPICKFFHEARRLSQHVGENPVHAGSSAPGVKPRYYFLRTPEIPNVPEADIESTCHLYLTKLLELLFDCYTAYGCKIDPQQYFTVDNFSRINRTIEDAEEELGYPRGWTDIGDPNAIAYRWQLLRDRAGQTGMDALFEKHLGKTLPGIARLPPYVPPPESRNDRTA